MAKPPALTQWERATLQKEVSQLVDGHLPCGGDTVSRVVALLELLDHCAPHIRILEALRTGNPPSAADLSTVCEEILGQIDASLAELRIELRSRPDPADLEWWPDLVERWPDLMTESRAILDSELECRAVLQRIARTAMDAPGGLART